MAYLFGAYFVLWAVTFGYLLVLGQRQKRLQQELELAQRRQSPVSNREGSQ